MSNEEEALPTVANVEENEKEILFSGKALSYKSENVEIGDELVRREDIEDLIQDKIDSLNERRERVYRDFDRESDSIDLDDWHSEKDKIDAQKEKLLELLYEV